MRLSKKAERSMAKLAEMLAASGVTIEEIEEIKETAPTGREAVSMQAEAVLLFLESPAKFTQKQCKRTECGEYFGTNYRSVAYCSDTCRAKEVSRQIGVKWNYFKTEHERWGGEPPLVIPPAALQKIRQYIEFFQSIPPTQTQIQNQRVSDLLADQYRPTAYIEESDQVLPSLESQQPSSAHTSPQQLPPESLQESTPEVESPFDFA